MNKFKSIMTKNHTGNKECLHRLYTDRQVFISSVSSSEQPIEDEKIFYYREVSFQFTGTGFRTPEKTVLFVWIPRNVLVGELSLGQQTVFEDFILRLLSEPVNQLAASFGNDHKDTREKPEFSVQKVNQRIVPRNGCMYDDARDAFRLRILFRFPLINGHGLNGKVGFKGVRQLLDVICNCLQTLETDKLQKHVQTYQKQQEIRAFMRENDLLAFVADGSILPRRGESKQPMEGAIPFQTPESLRVTLCLSDGEKISGMGLKRGVTVITGGGYSGKSTLLDSLEHGIYNHIPGDGREYCLMEESSCKIYAEDGRYLSNVDISPFFTRLPGSGDINHFSTARASGSVSQAANIVEAVYGGCKCLLIDEDTSATNFMIRDQMMRRLVERETIIPFTDRVAELKERGVSTILVIGGSGEYLQYGDCVLMLDDYQVLDKTTEAKKLLEETNIAGKLCDDISWVNANVEKNAITTGHEEYSWMREKYLPKFAGEKEFYLSKLVQIEHARYIKIDEYVADITRLTAIDSEEQINSLTRMMEGLLMETGNAEKDLNLRCNETVDKLFAETKNTTFGSKVHQYELWLEQVRGIDLLMAVSRLRGIDFSK